MEIKRSLKVGDTIVCKGISAKIGEILFQDCYNPDYMPEDRHYIDIEFKDIYGKYRHWKSHLDGGYVVWGSSEVYNSTRDKITLLRAISPLEGYFRSVGDGEYIGYRLSLTSYEDVEPGVKLVISVSGVSVCSVSFLIREDCVEMVASFGDDLDSNEVCMAVYKSLVSISRLPFPVYSLVYTVGNGRTFRDVKVSESNVSGEYKVVCR